MGGGGWNSALRRALHLTSCETAAGRPWPGLMGGGGVLADAFGPPGESPDVVWGRLTQLVLNPLPFGHFCQTFQSVLGSSDHVLGLRVFFVSCTKVDLCRPSQVT